MQILLTTYFFLIGIVLASFLNALMYRLDKEYKYPEIFTKSSHCEKCNKQLKWYDLIPILSYIFTKGKCSKCKTSITIYYPISELILGLSFAMFYFNNTHWSMYIVLLILFCLSYFDFNYKSIPQTPTLIFGVFGIIFLILSSIFEKQLILNATISGILLIVGLCMLLILMYGIKNLNLKDGFEGLGNGDFIVLFILSMFLSTNQFWVMFGISIVLAVLFFIPNYFTKRMTTKSALPLLPFFTLGYIIVVMYGEKIFEYIKQLIWL